MIHVNEYGAIARRKRKEMGLSIQELADKVGVSKNTISRFELGRNVTWQNIRMILNVLEIGLDDGEFYDLDSEYRPNSVGRFAAAIRAKRIYLSWPIETLAKKSGINPSTIYKIERGANDAHFSTYLRLLTVLGLHLDVVDEDGYIDYKLSEKGR